MYKRHSEHNKSQCRRSPGKYRGDVDDAGRGRSLIVLQKVPVARHGGRVPRAGFFGRRGDLEAGFPVPHSKNI